MQEQLQQPQLPPRPPSVPTTAGGVLPSDLAQAAAAAQNEGGGQAHAPSSNNIAGWLAKLSLARYTASMIELGVSHPGDIELITDLELAGLGARTQCGLASQSVPPHRTQAMMPAKAAAAAMRLAALHCVVLRVWLVRRHATCRETEAA